MATLPPAPMTPTPTPMTPLTPMTPGTLRARDPLARRARRLAAAAALAAVASAAPAARADTHRDEISIGGAARALRSASANALTGANLAGGSLGLARDLGRDLGVSPLPDLALWAEAGLVTGTATGTMFQALSTEIDELGITGGLAARYRLHRSITASARGALGAHRARAAIIDRGTTAYDHGWGLAGSAGVALDVFALSRPRFGLGVRAELGYAFAQPIALTLHTDRADQVLPLAMTALSIGHLALGGPTAGVSLLGQF